MGCCSSSTLSKVAVDAHNVGDTREPKKKAKQIGGDSGKAAGPVRIDLEPGSLAVAAVASPGAAGRTGPKVDLAAQEQPSLPGVVKSPRQSREEASTPAPVVAAPATSANPTPSGQFTAADVMAFGSGDGMGGAAGLAAVAAPALGIARPAAVPQAVRLVPVQANEQQITGIFQEYAGRLPTKLARTLDCSWEILAGEIAKEHAGAADGLEWHWLVSSEDAGPADAIGMVVYRVARGAVSNHGQVCHLSVLGDSWMEKLPAVLEAVRSAMFRDLPIASVRVCLWYADQDDGNFQLDKEVETVFKEAGFRWFTLTNAAGRRGQIMALRRLAELDPAAPPEDVDLVLGSCLAVPYATETAQADASPELDAADAAPRLPGNVLVIAESLRRRALQQRESSLRDNNAETGAAQQPDESEAQIVAAVGDLFERLARRGRGVLQTSDAPEPEATGAFLRDFLALAEAPAGADDPATSLTAPEERALCGAFLLQVNWKEHQVDPQEPSWARVAVHATGHLPGPDGQRELVAYLATEDDDIFVTVLPLPDDLPEIPHNELYQYCRHLSREAPPTEVGDDCTLRHVVLPRFHIRARAAAVLPKSFSQALSFQQPRELMLARVAGRVPPRGALLREGQPEAGQVLRLDRRFLFCVWHAQLDDLEVPLFAMVVGPNDWSPQT